MAQTPSPGQKEALSLTGRFTKAFTYSGPSSSIVHLEADVQQGKNAYVDVDSPFAGLPAELAGADWVMAANRDSLYSAVDLMEISVKARTRSNSRRPPVVAWLAALRFARGFAPLAEPPPALPMRLLLTMDVNIQGHQRYCGKHVYRIRKCRAESRKYTCNLECGNRRCRGYGRT
jgi:hypothetical protein